ILPTNFSFYLYRTLPDPHSFPTRRSSDLTADVAATIGVAAVLLRVVPAHHVDRGRHAPSGWPPTSSNTRSNRLRSSAISEWIQRSEEHTSELQSRSDLVCRLLLEKKKTKQ